MPPFLTAALLAALVTLALLYGLAVRFHLLLIALALGYGAGFVAAMGLVRALLMTWRATGMARRSQFVRSLGP